MLKIRYEGVRLPLKLRNITYEILKNPPNAIFIGVSFSAYKRLKSNSKLFEEVKTYINDLMPYLQKQKVIEDAKKITELQILDFFRTHKDLYYKFDKILKNEHLSHLCKQKHLMDSWEYYQKFKNLYKEQG